MKIETNVLKIKSSEYNCRLNMKIFIANVCCDVQQNTSNANGCFFLRLSEKPDKMIISLKIIGIKLVLS